MVISERGEQQIGELLRQLRRQRNLTQTELGGTHYSKSYISAVEKNKIRPSSHALEFFAQQLDQPIDFFTTWFEHLESVQRSGLHDPVGMNGQTVIWNEPIRVLDRLLERTDQFHIPIVAELPPLAAEHIDALPPSTQARYYLLKGVEAQAKHEYSAALLAFERALPLAMAGLQAVILDGLGQTYFLMHSFTTALHYHLRALRLLQQETANEAEPALLFRVELHCGEDYRALGAYAQATTSYERARAHLRAEHDLKAAAILYLGLGYCTYALLYQSFLHTSPQEHLTPEEVERRFHRARGFLIQSQSISQACGDRDGEATARLTLALAELDFTARRRQLAQRRVSTTGKEYVAFHSSFLQDAEEQCRQVLLSGHATLSSTYGPPESLDVPISVALAYLVRIYIQRAALARLSGNQETALRERVRAAEMCQQVLDALREPTHIGTLLRLAGSVQEEPATARPPTMPRALNLAAVSSHRSISQAEVYFAAGEVAEELGRAATSPKYRHECYSRADEYVHTSLRCASSAVSMQKRDPGYLIRSYQRWIGTMQERSTVSVEMGEDSDQTSLLLELFKEGLSQLQQAFTPSVWEGDGN